MELRQVIDKFTGINTRIGIALRRDCESQAFSHSVCLPVSVLQWTNTFLIKFLLTYFLIHFHSSHSTCESMTCYDMNTPHSFPEITSSPGSKIPCI